MTLIFTSVTYAIKAQKLLASNNIRTALTRSPAVTAVRGCGYGLRLSDSSVLSKAAALLENSGIKVVGTVKEY